MAADTHAADAHGLLHHHFDDMEQQRECTSLAMWLFLSTEIMTFGGLFFAYSLYRWKFPGAFHVGSHHLIIFWGTVNTFVLLFSSLTMALAVHSAMTRERGKLVAWLLATFVLGAAFLGIKAIEWGTDYQEGLIPAVKWTYYQDVEAQAAGQQAVAPAAASAGEGGEKGEAAETAEKAKELAERETNPRQVMMYFVLYFCMTGLHALHMIIGLVLVGVFIRMGMQGKFTNGNDQPVEILGLYWHFVDIVWIFLFPLLYLIAGFHG